jgi:hypothetical protein
MPHTSLPPTITINNACLQARLHHHKGLHCHSCLVIWVIPPIRLLIRLLINIVFQFLVSHQKCQFVMPINKARVISCLIQTHLLFLRILLSLSSLMSGVLHQN